MIVYLIMVDNGKESMDFYVHFGVPRRNIPNSFLPLLGNRKFFRTLLIPFLKIFIEFPLQLIYAIIPYKVQRYPSKVRQKIFGRIQITFSPPPVIVLLLSFPFSLNMVIKRVRINGAE